MIKFAKYLSTYIQHRPVDAKRPKQRSRERTTAEFLVWGTPCVDATKKKARSGVPRGLGGDLL